MSEQPILNQNDSEPPEAEIRLDDEKRIRVLSPGLLIWRRFVRNKLAIAGMVILIVMFAFSFIGGLLSPYKQQQVFRKQEAILHEYASGSLNQDLRYIVRDGESFSNIAAANFVLAKNNGAATFEHGGVHYSYIEFGDDFYQIFSLAEIGNVLLLGKTAEFTLNAGETLTPEEETAITDAIKAKTEAFDFNDQQFVLRRQGKNTVVSVTRPIAIATTLIFDAFHPDGAGIVKKYGFVRGAGLAMIGNEETFEFDGQRYAIVEDEDRTIVYLDSAGGESFASISNLMIRAASRDIFLSVDFKNAFLEAIDEGHTTFTVADKNGDPVEYRISRTHNTYTIRTETVSELIDMYAFPSMRHPLGTDSNGMDVLTRLMYGGRVSLIVGFVVVFIETIIGVIIGGISGYFGGAADMLLMRFIDIFNTIPFYPIVFILGAIMDTIQIPPMKRIFVLMIAIGLNGWTSIARIVRGQILSLREQDFMVATRATGIRTMRQIFVHLVPNVMPLLIVQATLSLGSIIIIEATLSFLGIGIKYPYASWGSIINAATNLYVMTNYWFMWFPAGVLIFVTVLGFNFVGDGLRDAFDPKMK